MLSLGTVTALVKVHMDARRQYRQMQQDQMQQRLVLRQSEEVVMPTADGNEEGSLFIRDEPEKNKHISKKEKKLVLLVNSCIDWIEQEKVTQLILSF
jgi:hypothetical protein